MIRTFLPGAWYGDYLPSGAFCATIPQSHIQTHLGIVPLPPDEPWGIGYPRCTDIGGFRFAGQAHSTLAPAAWERVGSSWRAIAPPCNGVSPTIYDRNGVLHCSDGSVGSQGYRYVNDANQIVSGDATYGPFHGLFEYTDLGDSLWIGQGADDGTGVRVWDGAVLRQLELGTCTFVRANRVDDRVALAFSKPEGVVLVQTTMAELRALPVVNAKPAPVPVPVPVPQPKPEPVPMQGLTDAQFATLQRIRAKYGATVTPDEIGAILNETAWIHRAEGLGLQAKPGGTSAVQPRTGVRVWNGIRIGNVGQDVLIGASVGIATPARGEVGLADPASFVAPVEPVGAAPAPVPVPVPVPPPAPVGVTKAELDAAIAAVRADCLTLIAASKPETLDIGPAVAAVLAGYEVSGRSAASFGHQHNVKLAITKRQG